MANPTSLFDKQPLYAYIKLDIGGSEVSTLYGSLYSNVDEENGVDVFTLPSVLGEDISNTAMSLTVTKQYKASEGGVLGKFVLTLFDDTAIYVEALINRTQSQMSNTTDNLSGVVENQNAIDDLDYDKYGDDMVALYHKNNIETIKEESAPLVDIMNRQQIGIEYGWSSKGVPIEGRYAKFNGQIQSYQLSFQGPSTVLEISGISNEDSYLSATGYKEFLGEIYHGKPSDIVAEIADELGFDYIMGDTIIETNPVMEDSQTYKTFSMNKRSYTSFIEEDLIPYSTSKVGNKAPYRLIVDTSDKRSEGSSGTVYFKPDAEASSVSVNLIDENGNVKEKVFNEDSEGELDEDIEGTVSYDESTDTTSYTGTWGSIECAREYEYYTGEKYNEVISFSPNYDFVTMTTAPDAAMAIDSERLEFITCTASGKTVVQMGEDANGVLIGDATNHSDGNKVVGLSSSTFDNLAILTQHLWAAHTGVKVTAEIELLGDPLINRGDNILVSVYTKYGFKHHTSGKYYVKEVEDSVDGGSFVTTLSLMCNNDNRAQEYIESEAFYSGGNGNTGGSYGGSYGGSGSYTGNISWLKIANGEVGYTEGSGNDTKYGSWIGQPNAPWCASFVSWCLAQSGNTNVSWLKSASCNSLASQASQKGKFHTAGSGYVPKPGDLFLDGSTSNFTHVGFVATPVTNGGFGTLEGNSSDQVRERTRQVNGVGGYIELP